MFANLCPTLLLARMDNPIFTFCMWGLQCVVKGVFKWCGCILIKSEHFINHHINTRKKKKSAYQTVIVIKHWFQCSACRLTVCAFSLCGPLKQPITTSTVWGSLTVNSEPRSEYDVFTCLLTLAPYHVCLLRAEREFMPNENKHNKHCNMLCVIFNNPPINTLKSQGAACVYFIRLLELAGSLRLG